MNNTDKNEYKPSKADILILAYCVGMALIALAVLIGAGVTYYFMEVY